MKLFDATLGTLERALDVRLERQNVLAGNVANVDTPGFMPVDLDFPAAMTQALQAAPSGDQGVQDLSLEGPRQMRELSETAVGATPSGAPLVQAEGARPGLDGNGVDLDRTMVAMAENALQYAASAKAAGKKLAILRYVASDGAA